MTQQSQRRYSTFIDQHGRRWGANIEVRTGHAVGEFEPRDFRAPVLPPNKHIRHGGPNGSDPVAIVIDYESWARESTAALAEWERRLREYARSLSAQGQVAQMLRDRPPELMDLVGPSPNVTALPVIQAARAGNPWVLRFEGDMPAAADPFFPALAEDVTMRREPEAETYLPEADPFAEVAAPPTITPVGEYDFEDSITPNGYCTFPDGTKDRAPRETLERKLKRKFPDHYAAWVQGQESPDEPVAAVT